MAKTVFEMRGGLCAACGRAKWGLIKVVAYLPGTFKTDSKTLKKVWVPGREASVMVCKDCKG